MKGGVFSDVIAAIDVGTTKICVLIARYSSQGITEIIGMSKVPSHGLRKGIVIDIAQTVESIKAAVQEASLMAGCSIETACVGVSGSHIKSFNCHGAVPIKRQEVTQFDVDNVIAAASAIAIPEGQQILHVLPQYYMIDGQEKIQEPRGMMGVRLETCVHIITGSISSVQNVIKCCELAGIKISDIVLEQLASALAVLSDDERTLGVGVLDIGGGTSDFAVYQSGSIRYTAVIPIAGNQFTHDLAIGLYSNIEQAEKIKKDQSWIVDSPENALFIQTAAGEYQRIETQKISYIVHARAEELILHVKKHIDEGYLKQFLSTGIVFTGGGSLLNGLIPLAGSMLNIPTRIGKPAISSRLALENPMYATGYGLLLHAIAKKESGALISSSNTQLNYIFSRMKSWILDLF